tara:strand:+ start:1389 stop:2477 length:1089 start_codon:yes stop_codon:yes gene_type:complete
MINVNEPFLPPLSDVNKYLDKIWDRKWLTNNGPLVQKLEIKLKKYLDVKNLLFLSNGTIALQLAIKALDLKNEIITTPFSYIATSNSIFWEGCKPIFVDIDPYSLNIDPEKIKEKISKKTTAILATHVYGNPCDIENIKNISREYNLKVIYDAAHCFGTKYNKKSIFSYGDISTVSFHATKLYHTVEGGAVFTKNNVLHKKMAFLRNFGHDGLHKYSEVGINAKNSEVHAAIGLCNFNYINKLLKSRKDQSNRYFNNLKNSSLKFIKINPKSEFNFSYFPIIFNSEKELIKVTNKLTLEGINTRRYFYPSLNNLDLYKSKFKLPISDDISKKVICLPLYYKLNFHHIDNISNIILNTLANHK